MVNRPACKNEYKREEEKKQERHYVKVHRDWDEKSPPLKAPEKDSLGEHDMQDPTIVSGDEWDYFDSDDNSNWLPISALLKTLKGTLNHHSVTQSQLNFRDISLSS